MNWYNQLNGSLVLLLISLEIKTCPTLIPLRSNGGLNRETSARINVNVDWSGYLDYSLVRPPFFKRPPVRLTELIYFSRWFTFLWQLQLFQLR